MFPHNSHIVFICSALWIHSQQQNIHEHEIWPHHFNLYFCILWKYNVQIHKIFPSYANFHSSIDFFSNIYQNNSRFKIYQFEIRLNTNLFIYIFSINYYLTKITIYSKEKENIFELKLLSWSFSEKRKISLLFTLDLKS